MRSFILTLLFLSLAIIAFSQRGDNYIQLSENITTVTKDFSGFDKLEISEDFEVYIQFSDTDEKVEIESNENLHDLIEVKKNGKTLKVNTRSYSTGNWSGSSNAVEERLVAYITMKQLTEIRADEDVVIKLNDKLQSDNLSIYLEEDSTLEGHLEVKNLTVDLDEDSVLEIEGSADKMKVSANEDSMIEGADFTVGNLSINLNEDSEAKLIVNGEIDLKARGDSYFHFKGDGEFVRKILRGDSEVRNLR